MPPRLAPTFWLWLQVAVAGLAMVATLPGRTQGLGLITEPLLRDLDLNRERYADMNLWATLLGAAFCVPWGWLLDRLGTRSVLVGTLVALSGVVIAMSGIHGSGTALYLFVLILLTRGLGQSGLSVVSLTLVGKAAGRRLGTVIGIYSCIVAVGFFGAFALIKYAFEQWHVDWRTLWAGIGWSLATFGFVAIVLARPALPTDPRNDATFDDAADRGASATLGQALATPVFWIFALASSYYGLVAAGISLFNESILDERGFDRSVFLKITAFTPLVGLASNLATGWLAERWPLPRLLAGAMALLTTALVAFPYVQNLAQVFLYATVMAIVGGMITVLFFAVWSKAYGPVHLGKIQGAAQLITVLASAVGPRILASCKSWTGSYILVFQYGAALAGLLAVAAWWTAMPHATAAMPDKTLSPIPATEG
jgi:MFS family permease